METTVESFRLLGDEQLLAEVRILAARERTATTVLIASLAEVDSRRLYLSLGYPSLFVYCIRELHFSDGAAYRRIAAARIVSRFPVALNYLADGALSLTTLSVIAPHLTIRNHMALLEAASYKTRSEVEQQVAALDPASPDLVTLHLRVRRDTYEKLRRAQDLLRHVLPNGDPADVFDRALTLLVADLEKKKLGAVTRPRRARTMGLGSRHIPAHIRRVVSRRDGGRCAFIGSSGRCPETGFLEFHHVVPFARGGTTTVENLQLRCRAHNQYEAEVAFGPQPEVARDQAPTAKRRRGTGP